MRLIDADYVLDSLCVATAIEPGDKHFLHGIEAAREIVQNAPIIPEEEARQWISVTERLPERDGIYLATTKNRFKQVEVCLCGYIEDEEPSWITGMQEDVLAWMPLPEPYEPEEEIECEIPQRGRWMDTV